MKIFTNMFSNIQANNCMQSTDTHIPTPSEATEEGKEKTNNRKNKADEALTQHLNHSWSKVQQTWGCNAKSEPAEILKKQKLQNWPKQIDFQILKNEDTYDTQIIWQFSIYINRQHNIRPKTEKGTDCVNFLAIIDSKEGKEKPF